MAELQHNGAATGLIDFTYSSLVALYFATSDMDEEDAAVHIINIYDPGKYREIHSDDLSKTVETLLKNNKGALWVWEPSNLNNRIPKQHSIFIFGEPIIDEKLTRTIKIDKESKSQIMAELRNYHNIEAFTLFNDLTGFAKENSQNKPYTPPESLKQISAIIKGLISDAANIYETFQSLDQTKILDETSAGALFLRASFRLGSNDNQGAIDDYTKLLKYKPDLSLAYLLRAKSKIKLNDYDGARQDVIESLKLTPNFPDAFDLLEWLNTNHPKSDEDRESSSS